MAATKKQPGIALSVECLESRELLAAALATPSVLTKETFDSTLPGLLPKGWSQWSSPGSFKGAIGRGFNRTNGLLSRGLSGQTARSWYGAPLTADVKASANVFLDSTRLIPGQILVRGSNLDSTAPTYYAVSVTRGMDVELVRVVNGASTVLARLRSTSSRYISNQWVKVSLEARGATLKVQIQRQDTKEYLAANGTWQRAAATAITKTDAKSSSNPQAISAGGLVGLNRASGNPGDIYFDEFQAASLTSGGPSVTQTFNQTLSNTVPADWFQWSDDGPFGVSAANPLASTGGLIAEGASRTNARIWTDAPAPANSQVSASVFLNSQSAASVFLRGNNLSSTKPTYYAATVTKGMRVELTRVVNGVATTLGRPVASISSRYISNKWARVSLAANGNNLQVQVQRLDTGEYLNSGGQWQRAAVAVINVTDTVSLAGGKAGLGRTNATSEDIAFDNFQVTANATQPISVRVGNLANNAVVRAAVNVQALVTSSSPVTKIEYYVDNVRQTTTNPASTTWQLDPRLFTDGPHTLSIVAYNQAGNLGRASVSFTTSTAGANVSGANIPRHYSHIRIAQLAYSGTPLTEFERKLLRESVDLVVSNDAYLNDVQRVAPNTPQLIYSNISSLYRELLTDWLNYADRTGANREGAFFHASTPTKFSGHSSSSIPVNWFWGVYRGGVTANFEDMTSAARNSTGEVEFGGVGSSMYIGYTDKFREINVTLARGARNGWAPVFEYATRVNADGEPIAWAPLKIVSDGTAGFSRNGTITFDPSANPGWVASEIGNHDARLFYVRVRTAKAGSAPIARTLLGRDFVNARGSQSGVIPVFDRAADRNGDSYLDDAEYARRVRGKDARFYYESRVFQGVYGQMRPATIPSNPAFRNWAVDFHKRLLQKEPLADGVFMDNSSGKAVVEDDKVLESVANYAEDYGALLNAVGKGIGPKFVMANTSGGGITSDPIIRQNTSYFEEFVIRAQAHTWQQFEDLALILAHRNTLRTTPSYAVLDSMPTGGSPTDPRTQISTLAYYYLLQDPKYTFLDFFGGYEPSSSWARHWSEAVKYNVGQPTAGWSLFASGGDPSNRARNYRIYQRSYTNALVLYKPLSYTLGVAGNGGLGNGSATTHNLNGTYRPLLANGSLGAPVTKITLRNGEGSILVRV